MKLRNVIVSASIVASAILGAEQANAGGCFHTGQVYQLTVAPGATADQICQAAKAKCTEMGFEFYTEQFSGAAGGDAPSVACYNNSSSGILGNLIPGQTAMCSNVAGTQTDCTPQTTIIYQGDSVNGSFNAAPKPGVF